MARSGPFVLALALVAPLLAAAPAHGATTMGAISIDGDVDLAAQAAANGWPGSGAAGDPIRISSVTVDAAGADPAVEIANTTLALRIESLVVTNGHSVGVRLFQTRSVTIVGSTADGFGTGFLVERSPGTILDAPHATGSTGNAIALADSPDARVLDSTTSTDGSTSIPSSGVDVVRSPRAIVMGGASIETGSASAGVSVSDASDNVTVRGLNITATGYTGVFVDHQNDARIGDNVVGGIVYAGVYVFGGERARLAGNAAQHGTIGALVEDANDARVDAQRCVDLVVCVQFRGSTGGGSSNTDSSGGTTGVRFETSSGVLSTNDVVHDSTNGIEMARCRSCIVTGALLTDIACDGFRAWDSPRAQILAIRVAKAGCHGIGLVENDTDAIVAHNLIDAADVGLGDTTLNTSSNNDRALYWDNVVTNSTTHGLVLIGSVNVVIRENVFSLTRGPDLAFGQSVALVYDNVLSGLPAIDREDRTSGIVWSVSPRVGTNIVGGPLLGGNAWGPALGPDVNGDGFAETSWLARVSLKGAEMDPHPLVAR